MTLTQPGNRWTYASHGGENYPVRMGQVWKVGPHIVACADLTRELDAVSRHWPSMPKMIYTDPPWNNSMVRGFYTKAGRPDAPDYPGVIYAILAFAKAKRLPCWLEASLHERDSTTRMINEAGGQIQRIFPITYYGKSPAILYQTTFGGPVWVAPPDISGKDDADTPRIVMRHAVEKGFLREGDPVLDTCVGLGLSAAAALAAGLTLYASELSPFRASATLTRLAKGTGLNPQPVGTL